MYKTIIIYALLTGVLMACSIQPREPKNSRVPRTGMAQIQKRDFEVKLAPLPEPFKYQLQIHSDYLARLAFEVNGEVPELRPQGHLVHNLLSGSAYQVKVYEKVQGRWEYSPSLSQDLAGVVPMDTLIEGAWILQGDTQVRAQRIFLQPGSQIQTQGFDLQLQAREIISLKTPGISIPLIYSFPPQSQAVSGPGKSAGVVFLEAKKAIGDLQIELYGQRGANGPIKKQLPPAAAGVPGKNIFQCLSTPGGKGQDGKNGEEGAKGFPGGDGGTVFLKIMEQKEFVLNFSQHPGLGGLGGPGALGQKGGEGGRAPQVRGCPLAKPGAKGKDGKPGGPGAVGTPGRAGTLVDLLKFN